MSNTFRPATRPSSGQKGGADKGRGRPGSTTARPASASSGRRWWPMVIVGVVVLVTGGAYVAAQSGDSGGGDSAPYVGGDLHTITVIDDRLYVGGHDGVAVSTDEGQSWQAVSSLEGADAMGWAQTSGGLLVGGHPGLYRSTDNGASFTKTTGDSQVEDVHALGAAEDTVYVSTPTAGLLTSTDGGATWTSRNKSVGQTFMGTILVDSDNPQHIIAPDMQNGVVTSSDGGRTWAALGGPGGTMSVGWDPTDIQRLIAIGMGDGALSGDGGGSWTDLQLPDGTSVATFSEDGSTLFAAALDSETARVYSSTDSGKTWNEL